jgi:hypothetical protein
MIADREGAEGVNEEVGTQDYHGQGCMDWPLLWQYVTGKAQCK